MLTTEFLLRKIPIRKTGVLLVRHFVEKYTRRKHLDTLERESEEAIASFIGEYENGINPLIHVEQFKVVDLCNKSMTHQAKRGSFPGEELDTLERAQNQN